MTFLGREREPSEARPEVRRGGRWRGTTAWCSSRARDVRVLGVGMLGAMSLVALGLPVAPVAAAPVAAAPVAPAPATAAAKDGGAAPAGAPPPVRLDVNASGPKLYEALCAACHAKNGEGGAADHAPSLVSATFLSSAADAFLREAIAHGRPGTSMGAYGRAVGGPLPPPAVDRLVGFLRSKGPAFKPPPAAGAGDAARGAALYASTCKTCHGDATVRGEAVHLANPAFLAAASDAFLKYAVVHGREGTKMAPFAGVFRDAQIDDVVAYVRSLASTPPAVVLLPAPTGHEPVVLDPHGKDPAFTLREGRFVSAAQVKDALAAKKRLVIVDARPPSDWMRVHIPGAVSVPYHDMSRLTEIPQDVWVVAYCACPHHLSGEVVDALRTAGHARAVVLDEGIIEWHRRGYPVVAAKGVTRPVPEAAPSLPAAPPAPAGPAPARPGVGVPWTPPRPVAPTSH